MRQRTALLTVLMAALMMLGLTACGTDEEPALAIDEAQATSDLEANLQANLGAMAQAGAFLPTSSVACDAAASATPLVVVEGDTATPIDPNAPVEPTVDTFDCAASLDLAGPADGLVEGLMQNVFVPANIEEKTDTSITYRLSPAAVCGATVSSENPEPVYDADCVEMLEQMPVRFEVSSRTAGDLDVAVKVGADNTRIAALEIYRGHLAVEADLGKIADAYEAFGRAQDPTFDFPGEVDGTLRLELTRNGEQDFTLALGIVDPIHVEVDGSLFEHDEPFVLDIARANPAVSARLDGVAKELALTWALGAIDLSMPAAMFGGTSETCATDSTTGTFECTTETYGPTGGTLAAHLDGLASTMLLNALGETIEVTGVGLGDGPSTLTLDGKPLVTVNLNADSGRSFDATLTSGPDGLQIAVRPSFALAVDFAFANAAEAWSDVSAWMLDERIEARLDGDATPTVAIADGELEVVAGTLTLSSKAHGTVSVGAGQCVIESTGELESEHVLAGVSAGACGQSTEPTPAPEPVP